MLRRQGFANILQHLLSVNQHAKNEEVWLQAIKLNQAHIFSNQLEKNTQLAQLLSIEPAETSRTFESEGGLGSDLKHAHIHHFQELPPQLLLHFYLLTARRLSKTRRVEKAAKRYKERKEKDRKRFGERMRIEKDWKGTKFFQSSLSSRFILERLGDGFLDLLVGWLVFEERLYHGCGISSQQGLENLKFLQKVHWTSTSTLQARLYSLRAILYPHLIKLKCFNQRRCFRRLEPCWYHQTFKRVDLVQRLQANVVSIQSCRNEAIWVNNKIKMCEIVCWPHLNGENWVLNRVPEDAFGIGKGLDPCFHWSQSFHGWNISLNRDLCQVPQGILHNKPCQNEKTSQFAMSIQIYILLTHVKPSFLHTVELTEHNSLQWS